MDDVVAVQIREARQQVVQVPQRRLLRERAEVAADARERAAAHVLHHHDGPAVVGDGEAAVAHDVAVLEVRQRPHLAPESLQRGVVSAEEGERDALDGDELARVAVHAEVYGGRGALPQQVLGARPRGVPLVRDGARREVGVEGVVAVVVIVREVALAEAVEARDAARVAQLHPRHGGVANPQRVLQLPHEERGVVHRVPPAANAAADSGFDVVHGFHAFRLRQARRAQGTCQRVRAASVMTRGLVPRGVRPQRAHRQRAEAQHRVRGSGATSERPSEPRRPERLSA
mmetsp:Transcript_17067/g.52979  ORF Transcript_17067/g.52979 Transcript_17067/m.52979 type:complete len:287 (+) Transcript_17067:609-1469(+)